MFIGYGLKGDTPVWLVKNFFGTAWNGDGHFLVAQGANSFCIEHEAFAIIPLNFSIENTTTIGLGDRSLRGQNLPNRLDVDPVIPPVVEIQESAWALLGSGPQFLIILGIVVGLFFIGGIVMIITINANYDH